MKAYAIQDRFGLDALKPITLPDPEVGPGQILIRLHAASLNYRDWMMVSGQYNPKQPLPLVPLSDGAGEVAAVGEGVTRVKVGDRVAGTFTQAWVDGVYKPEYWRTSTLGGPLPGMLAEYALLSEQGVVVLPEYLSYEEGATLPCAAVTAWHGLFVAGNLQPGQTVLVQGTGGVSLFALQLARMAGAQVFVTSSSDAKLERAKALGAAGTINYNTTPEWGDAVKALTNGVGVDHIIEVGGAGTLPQSFRAVRDGGHIAVIGVLAAGAGDINPIPILLKALRLAGILVGSRQMFEDMNRALSGSGLKPVIDRVFAFEEAGQALVYLKSGSHFGKIVIRID